MKLTRSRFANSLILASIVYLGALLIYAVSNNASGYYLAIGVIIVLLLGITLKLPRGLKFNISFLILSAGLTVFFLEVLLGLGFLEKIDGSDSRAPAIKLRSTAASLIGKHFDEREPIDVISHLRDIGIDAYPSINPYMLTKASAFSRNDELFPLGGISGKTIVACNEGGEYLIFESDEQGFHNPEGLWSKDKIDIITVGDSLTHGECVNSDKNTTALIRKTHENTLNLATSGSGPLIQLALIKEYTKELRPEVVLWFYCECNDLLDLKLESSDPSYYLYRNYLESDFRQELRNNQPKIDSFLSNWALGHIEGIINEQQFRLGDTFIDILKMRNLRTFVLRRIGAGTSSRIEPIDEADLQLFSRVLNDGKDHVSKLGGQLYFVYLPTWARYGNPDDTPGINHDAQLELIPFYDRILSIVDDLDIPIIDLKTKFDQHPDPLALWPFRLMGHFNEKGYQFVAERVLEEIEVTD